MTVAMPELKSNGLADSPSVFGGTSSAVAYLREWSEGLAIIGREMTPLIFTDIVPLHHWPMPAGETLRSFANPRMRHPRESPEDYQHRCQGAAASATAIAMRSVSLGIDPFVGLSQMHNIRGKIGMDTKLRYAYAIAHGVKAWDGDMSAESVTCHGIHPTTGETITITITITMAQQAGWTENAAYTKTPTDMLWARAMGRVLDRVASHILSGLASVDDLRDEPEPAPTVTRITVDDIAPQRSLTDAITYSTATTAGAQAMAEAQAVREAVASVALDRDQTHEVRTPETPAAPVEPSAVPAQQEPPGQDDPVVPDDAPVSEKTRNAAGAAFQRLGVTGPGQLARRAGIVRRVTGREVDKMADLTEGETRLVIDTLDGIRGATGWRVRLDRLERGEPIEPTADNQAPAEPPTGGNDHDPTTEPGFGQE